MSRKNTNKKDTNAGFDISSISGVLNLISSAFSIPEEPVSALPPALIMTGGKLKSGLSASAIKARIISRQSEAGLPVGNVFADGPNTSEAMISIAIDEIVNAFHTEAVVNVVIDPGISVQTIGVGNYGAPVISQGSTTTMGTGNGIIR
jgi:hypothetical protein